MSNKSSPHKSNKSSTQIIQRPSPNFNDRKGQAVSILVIHYTAMATAEAAIDRLCDPNSQVSSHYVIDEKGSVYQLVAEENRAWHAGVSFWNGKVDLNSSSVGIEIANDGSSEYPAAQMESVIALSQAIVKRHKIQAFNVVAHSDIAADRKQDPGILFNWKSLSDNALGVFPAPTEGDYKISANWGEAEVKAALTKIGYQPTFDQSILLTAFQRHFYASAFVAGANPGFADVETRARLACLSRRKAIVDGLAKRRSQNSG